MKKIIFIISFLFVLLTIECQQRTEVRGTTIIVDSTMIYRGDTMPPPPYADMESLTYDPNTLETDAFDLTNHYGYYMQLDSSNSSLAPHTPGRIFYDTLENGLTFYNDIVGSSMQMGREMWARVVNLDYDTLHNGTVVTIDTLIEARAVAKKLIANGSYSFNLSLGVVTNDILQGNEGEVTTYGVAGDLNTSMWEERDILYVSPTDSGELTNIRPTYPKAPMPVAAVVFKHATQGAIYVFFKDESYFYQFDGNAIQKQNTYIETSGGNIYCDVELLGGGNLPVQLSSDIKYLDCTNGSGTGGRARVQLTEGTATVPAFNYVYVKLTAGDPVLESSTAYPTDSIFAFVAYISVLDDVITASEGALLHQRTTDAIYHYGRGRISYIDERLREMGAEYKSGVNFASVVNSTPSPDSVSFTVTNGIIYQLHRQIFPNKDILTDGIYIVNHPTTPYTKINDLSDSEALQEQDGTSLSGLRFNWVIWGAVNKDTTECKLFLNLPNGSYSTNAEAISDADNTAVTTIPAEMKGTGFLNCRLPYRHQSAAGGTYTNISTSDLGLQGIDLRGLSPGYNLGGAGIPAAATFSDSEFSIFNTADNTKVINISAAQITTGNTRTITMPDKDVYLVDTSDIAGFSGGGGDVYKSGTLVDNQIMIAVDDSTIEGTANHSYDGKILTVVSGVANSLAVGNNINSFTGTYTTIFGAYAGDNLAEGPSNTLIGAITGDEITTGTRNTVVGDRGMGENQTGNDNTIIGALAAGSGLSATAVSENTVIGAYAGNELDGNENVFIGYYSGENALSGNIMIGNEAGRNETGSNKLYIDNNNTATPLIHGDFAEDTLTINGELGITDTAKFYEPPRYPWLDTSGVAGTDTMAMVIVDGRSFYYKAVLVPQKYGLTDTLLTAIQMIKDTINGELRLVYYDKDGIKHTLIGWPGNQMLSINAAQVEIEHAIRRDADYEKRILELEEKIKKLEGIVDELLHLHSKPKNYGVYDEVENMKILLNHEKE